MKPSKAQAKRACEESSPFRKLAEKRVPHAEAKREIRKTGARVVEHQDGKGFDVHDHRPGHPGIQRLYEMQAEHRRMQYEIGQNMVENTYPVSDRVPVKYRDGRRAAIPQMQAESFARKGGMVMVRRSGYNTFGEDGLNMAGHTHMGEPQDWQRRSCPGCRRGA
jgi:hypothetical protein